MVSGRFNNDEMVAYIKNVRDILTQKGVPIIMVETQGPGDVYGTQTLEGLYMAKALLAFCGTNYGQRTGDFARDIFAVSFLKTFESCVSLPPKRSMA